MNINNTLTSLRTLLKNIPEDWINLTTHRLDIYRESEAKSEFLHELKSLIRGGQITAESMQKLPTAYDYIRLGHQLSSLLEWVLAEINQVNDDQVITFASKTMPILALLRNQAIYKQKTYIYYDSKQSPLLDEARLQNIYDYRYQLIQTSNAAEIPKHDDGMVVFVTQQSFNENIFVGEHIDATININSEFGSYIVIHQAEAKELVAAVQHVRRRETIAMSPTNCLHVLRQLAGEHITADTVNEQAAGTVAECITLNTGSQGQSLVASSGLSIQYAILMGLVEDAIKQHPGKAIKIILPPNCYGGTNDQSRRVAELIPQVGIVDLLVDGGADLVNSLEQVLDSVAAIDGVPIVLAEIPTNPRVEVPDMDLLGQTLVKTRITADHTKAIAPTFMVDQTFCPNVKLLHDDSELNDAKVISFSSGSKFPSGGRCIAGYCAANQAAEHLMPVIAAHLNLSDNAVDANQLNTLAQTMPSMPERIVQAYQKTRELVNHVQQLLPDSKIFYVDEEMAQRGFMPSVFSLDLPVNTTDHAEPQEQQKELNKQLIRFMIAKHPKDCKNCVSYGQLKGSYWTIPATSTQGTTKEDDKDYVVRVSISPDVDVNMLAQSFTEFCQQHRLV